MMDEIVFYPTVIIGLLCIAVYWFRCHKEKRDINLAVLVNMLLSASGVSCGAFLMLSTVFASLRAKLAELNLYIFIAGLVVLIVSVQSIVRETIRK